ncbi:unnamed protein product [Ceratitis capitata]|uniref:(Mediterranean fruit fly) hypothetical protein n=1 Tax=Ceratitis capitata TaxID=7213 RepID=A0A811UKN3_CERCA|nr:unnamed protein product [Ceratitis capitata]
MTPGLNINRLNLPNMVDRQLNEASIPETYFRPVVIGGKRKALEEKPPMATEMGASFDSIVATVHTKLRKTSPKLHTACVETPETNMELKDYMQKSTLPLKAASIPQIKAVRAQKQQQRMRRSMPHYADYNDPISQKRFLEVREQKRILEDMLAQHQRLQHDRQSIAMEIQAMREHLSDIRHKLDISLKRLTTKPIVRSEVLLKPKVFFRPQQCNRPNLRKSPSPPNKPPTLPSILKSPNLAAKPLIPPAKPAVSPVRTNKSPARKPRSPSRNVKQDKVVA